MSRRYSLHELRRSDTGALITGSRRASSLRAQILQRLTFLSLVTLLRFLRLAIPAQGQLIKVGSFTKRSGMVTQALAHGLGLTPKALTTRGGAPGGWVEVRE